MRQIHKAILIFMILLSALIDGRDVNAQLFFNRLAPADIANAVRNRGFYDVAYPYFRGDIYVVDATERRGLRVRLVVDPRTGEITERLIIGRNNRVYPAQSNIIDRNYDDNNGREQRVIERPQPRSNVEVDEPSPRIKSVQQKKRRVEQPATAEPKSDIVIVRPTIDQPVVLPKEPIGIVTPRSAVPNVQPPALTQPVIAAPTQAERGTRENPRNVGPKVGPIVPAPIGVE